MTIAETRTNPPFFNRESTRRFLAEVASSQRILIYVAAGVTIDKSGMGWAALVRSLASYVGFSDPQVDRLLDVLEPAQVASVIAERYHKKYPKNWLSKIIGRLRSDLYSEAEWRGGQYASAVVLMCTALAERGADVLVVTTNYDQHLESAQTAVTALQPGREIVRFEVAALTKGGPAATADEVAEVEEFTEPQKIPLLHVHGYVPEKAIASVDELIVFSENDYNLTETDVNRILGEQFEERDVLILGSGLDDPPLIRALLASASRARNEGLRRWAVMPRQGLASDANPFGGPMDTDDDIVHLVQLRANQLTTKIVAPDFYSQASQLPREIAVLIAENPTDASLADLIESAKLRNYKTRLDEWWDHWYVARKPDIDAAQASAHRALFDEAAAIRTGALEDPEESIKLDLWLRWQPDERELRLWASSTGTWRDEKMMRRLNIMAEGTSPAVRSFVNGTALLMDEPSEGSRWYHYFAVPIYQGDEDASIIVGVAVLGTARNEDSQIVESDTQLLIDLKERLTRIGRELTT